jgi:hypothetical protein
VPGALFGYVVSVFLYFILAQMKDAHFGACPFKVRTTPPRLTAGIPFGIVRNGYQALEVSIVKHLKS